MSTPQLSDIRQALADTIAAGVPGLRTAGIVPGQVNPPVCVVRPTRGTFVNYQQTMGSDAAVDWTFDLVLMVSASADRSGQAQLDGFLSTDQPTSLWAALRNNETLVTATWPAGLVSYAYMDRGTAYGLMEYGGVEYLAATLMVIVGAP